MTEMFNLKSSIEKIYSNKNISDDFVDNVILNIELTKESVYIFMKTNSPNDILVFESLPTMYSNVPDEEFYAMDMADIDVILEDPYRIYKFKYPSTTPEIIFDENDIGH